MPDNVEVIKIRAALVLANDIFRGHRKVDAERFHGQAWRNFVFHSGDPFIDPDQLLQDPTRAELVAEEINYAVREGLDWSRPKPEAVQALTIRFGLDDGIQKSIRETGSLMTPARSESATRHWIAVGTRLLALPSFLGRLSRIVRTPTENLEGQ